MNHWRITTKIFANFFLIFLITVACSAQLVRDTDDHSVPAGTVIRVQMDNGINSKVSSVGDTFTATIVEPVTIREIVLIPIGTVVEGKVLKVKRASAGNKNGILLVSFESLTFANGDKRRIKGQLVKELVAETSKLPTAVAIVGATALGGILGSVSNIENGTLIGAGIGAVAGSGIALLKK